jgi:hypothetical protein
MLGLESVFPGGSWGAYLGDAAVLYCSQRCWWQFATFRTDDRPPKVGDPCPECGGGKIEDHPRSADLEKLYWDLSEGSHLADGPIWLDSG